MPGVRHYELVVRLKGGYPRMAAHFSADGRLLNQHAFNGYIAEVMEAQLAEQRDSVLADSSAKPAVKSQRLQWLSQVGAAWRRTRRKTGLTMVLPMPSGPAAGDVVADGSPLEQAAAYLKQYWERIFSQKRSVRAAQDHLLSYAPVTMDADIDKFD